VTPSVSEATRPDPPVRGSHAEAARYGSSNRGSPPGGPPFTLDPVKAEPAAELLSQTHLFAGLQHDALLRIAERAHERSFRKGALIFYEGDIGDAFYVVAEGTVKIFVSSGHGDEMVLATLRRPDGLGEIALLDDGPRTASAEALDAVTLLAFTRSTFQEVIHQDRVIADALLRSAGRLFRRMTSQAADLVFLDLEGRVAKLLSGMADERGESKESGIVLDLGVTQGDLASMVGGSRQSVNQILHALESRGFLEIGGRTVVIKQPDALRRRAGLE
jgi:CRP/FNR family transcriptional regulator, cyclic AMP receptor protein